MKNAIIRNFVVLPRENRESFPESSLISEFSVLLFEPITVHVYPTVLVLSKFPFLNAKKEKDREKTFINHFQNHHSFLDSWFYCSNLFTVPMYPTVLVLSKITYLNAKKEKDREKGRMQPYSK